MKFTVAGDMAIQRRLPETYDGFEEIKEYIMQGDARFFNLETVVCHDSFANYFSGGTWLRCSEAVASDSKRFGFNLATFANNHCMDFSYDGFLQTVDFMDKQGFVHAGCGRNLSEAARPRYLETPHGRVALIACSTDFAPGAMAGEMSRLLPGRPGINGLRVKKTVIVEKNELEALKEIACKTGVNCESELDRKDGYLPPVPENVFELDGVRFEVGSKPHVKYEIDKDDMSRLEKYVEEASFQADFVLLSVHTHIISGPGTEDVPKFFESFARRMIDAGVSAFIGHGPHLLRAVEIYKNRPIFYSLGDFMLQLENVEYAPEDFYNKFGFTSDTNLYRLFKERTKNFTIGLQRQKVMMEAVIPYFEMENGELKSLEFMPIELGYGMKHSQIGLPRRAKNDEILLRLKALSEDYGLKMDIKDGIAKALI